ncbi:MAG: hypothetical protein R2862_11610 [Thermoanaerobaculia bacterium]
MDRERGPAQCRRPFGVRREVLRVHDLGRIPDQQELAAEETEPLQRSLLDPGEGAAAPVARDFAGRQRMSDRILGELARVRLFELRVAAPGPQRLVGAAGAGVIADVEVGSELGGGEVELAAEEPVAQRHRGEHQEHAGHDGDGSHRVTAGGTFAPRDVEDDDRQQQQRVLAVERQESGDESQAEVVDPRRAGPRLGHQEEKERGQREIEARLLDQSVEEDRGRGEGEEETRDEPGARSEEAPSGDQHERRGAGAEQRLDGAHQRQAVAKRRVERSEEPGVERRLVVDPAAEPVAGREPEAPGVVARGVAEPQMEERRRTQGGEVEQADGEREEEDQQRIAPDRPRPARSRRRGGRLRGRRAALARALLPGTVRGSALRHLSPRSTWSAATRLRPDFGNCGSGSTRGRPAADQLAERRTMSPLPVEIVAVPAASPISSRISP